MQEKSFTNFQYLKFYRQLLGKHFYYFLIINFFVGLLDGFGLAMFIPLLSVATGDASNNASLGKLAFITDIFEVVGIKLNLVTVLIMMVVIFSLKALASYIRQMYFNWIKFKSVLKIRYDITRQLQYLTYDGFITFNAGRLQYSMISETQRVIGALNNFINVIQSTILVSTFFVLALFANWQFAILVAIGGFLSNFIYKRINKGTKKMARRLSKFGNKFNDILIQAVHNFKYLKATNYFAAYQKFLKNDIYNFERTQFDISKWVAIGANIREPIIISIIAIVIIIQVNVLDGNFSSILVSLLFFYRALTYLVTMQTAWNNFLANAPGLEAIQQLKNEFNKYQEPEPAKTPLSNIGHITLESISLQLGDKTILKDISLEIPAKSTIALVGESGAGKTTLANVISGLIRPGSGRILINDQELIVPQLPHYRDKIGYIAQEPVIFSDTLFNNVTFWAKKDEASLAKFYRVLELVRLSEFVQELPLREDAFLGNNGILISGGQKQRISIARELYKEVDVLIMDEATSALDSETEEIIKENIQNMHGQFIMVIIAHRLSTIKHADIIYLLQKGELKEHGDFDSLYQLSDTFKNMVDLQEV